MCIVVDVKEKWEEIIFFLNCVVNGGNRLSNVNKNNWNNNMFIFCVYNVVYRKFLVKWLLIWLLMC